MNLPENKKIILFDGVCNLCNTSVQFVIKHDQKDVFRFVALQSELGKKIINHIGISNQNIDSVILYEPSVAYYYKSDAAIQIAKNLTGFYFISFILQNFPKGFRDYVYDVIAKNRYNWFGKQEGCLITTPELKAKFFVK
jgi:predicted DCC family thiol-disulfide oxidoreductase YuxK